MSTSAAPPIAGPLARLRSWIRRRWKQVGVGLLLYGLMSVIAWRVPKRTSHWVRQNGGMVTCDKDRALACDVVDWFALRFGGGVWKHVNPVHRAISSARNDSEITWVNLAESPLQSDGLFNLRRLTGLTGAGLHSRQLGRGLDVFRGMPNFKRLGLIDVTTGQLNELKRLPQLEDVGLSRPQSADIGMEALVHLPRLTQLNFQDCTVTAELLASLPVLLTVESFSMTHCSNFDNDDLRHLKQLPSLKYFDVTSHYQGPEKLDDRAFDNLSQLKNLETLCVRTSWTEVTDAGLVKLGALKSLKTVIVWKIQCTPQQISRLQKAVPNCTLIY